MQRRRRPGDLQADEKPQPRVIWRPSWERAGDRGLGKPSIRPCTVATGMSGEVGPGLRPRPRPSVCLRLFSLPWPSGPAGAPHGCNTGGARGSVEPRFWHTRGGPRDGFTDAEDCEVRRGA
ncbi:hypothetical protein NDU88_004110 [Pleurodeles waltl]|uniref:Uncharacterized protein n=1 Tax=Pleurodeles waltl TaxID=8319 RepID=A0AAV7QAY2_PLEWA|nr:hypothetical protein NDU88_004110 [Pleurodeles waltl]